MQLAGFFYFYPSMDTKIPDEIFPVVDEEGNEISTAPRSVCHDGKSMLLHPVVHLHLFNSRGELCLQKRALTKDLLPGYWDSSAGGHINPGETPSGALKRETYEELGLTDINTRFLGRYIWESSREREFVWSFTGVSDATPVFNEDEIEEGRFWTMEEIRNKIGKDVFTPNFEHEFRMFLENF